MEIYPSDAWKSHKVALQKQTPGNSANFIFIPVSHINFIKSLVLIVK